MRYSFGAGIACCCVALTSCNWAPYAPAYFGTAPGGAGPAVAFQNPLFVPVADRNFLFDQVVDAVDDHFQIVKQQRVRLVGGNLTQGRIETLPTVGATFLEPWRADSTPGFERLHSTLQSIRRQATVRITPTEGGYLVEVVVDKELEDVNRPEHSTAGAMTRRYDQSLGSVEAATDPGSATVGWIPLGRDISLEQLILTDVQSRLSDVA